MVRINRVGITTVIASVVAISLSFMSCTIEPDRLELERARKSQSKGDQRGALKHYLRLRDIGKQAETKLLATFEAAKICYFDLKDYQQALTLWRELIDSSPKADVRVLAQKMVAEIQFTHLQNYPTAIIELNRLLELNLPAEEQDRSRIALGKAYFYNTNYFQARVEAETVLKESKNPASAFEALRLMASAYQEEKLLDRAVKTLQDTMSMYPDLAKKEGLALSLAVIYEEKKDFARAIEVLVEMRDQYPDQQFIDRRIASLKARALQLPGARGFRK